MPTCLFVICSLDSRKSESLFVTVSSTSDEDSKDIFVINLVIGIRTAHQELGSMDNLIQNIVFINKNGGPKSTLNHLFLTYLPLFGIVRVRKINLGGNLSINFITTCQQQK